MVGIGRSDLRMCLDTVHAIAAAGTGMADFAQAGFSSLKRLVAGDLTTLSVCALDSGHRTVVSDVPGAISRRDGEAFDRHLGVHPLVAAHAGNPAAATCRISDLVPECTFRASSLFADYYRPIRIDHAMAVPIHGDAKLLVGFVFNRRGRDFDRRERDRVELIRPHLCALYRMTRAVDDARAAWGVPAARPACDSCLTEREREVLHWLSGGKTDRDIGDILDISPRTVHKHLQRIYEKLGVETRTAAVVRAMSLGVA
jgi:DNA-binding CsgD family transcriptional regulator